MRPGVSLADIRAMLAAYSAMNPAPRAAAPVMRSPYALILDHGVESCGISLPAEYLPGLPNHCFYNTLQMCLEDPSLTYMEGYAGAIIPMHHAWALDSKGQVIDTTWDDPEGRSYLGIPFQTDYVKSAAEKSGYYSVMFNMGFRSILTDPPESFLRQLIFDKLNNVL